MATTYHELMGNMNEEVLGEFDDPADITAATRAFLAKVDPRDAFVVHRFASDLAAAMEGGRLCDPEITGVMLDEMIAWLAQHGTKATRKTRNAGSHE